MDKRAQVTNEVLLSWYLEKGTAAAEAKPRLCLCAQELARLGLPSPFTPLRFRTPFQ